MKTLSVLFLFVSLSSFSHDEGHGPKLHDAALQGGVVSPVVLFKDAGLGGKAPLKHKAEMVRSMDGTVRVYLYDEKMEPLKVQGLGVKAIATLISGKKGKVTKQNFDLQWKEDHYEGKSPRPTRKPFSIDVKIMEGPLELLSAFDNLD